MKISTISISICFLFFYPFSLLSASFKDSFESGDMSTTDASGFSWESLNRTSIVTQHPVDGNVVIFNGNSIYNIINDSRDWTAKNGENSLRFRYTAGQAQSEQRFDLGITYPEIWIKFWLRVPTNFSFGPSGGPNKFFALWSDGYSANGDGSTVWLSMSRSQDGTGADLWFSISGGFNASGGEQQRTPFITTMDQGRWMEFVLHYKVESTPGASDGVVQSFRRWSDESFYFKLHESQNQAIRIPDDNVLDGFKAGYILGWANAAYSQNTEWLLDDIEISEQNILGDYTISDSEIRPKAPILLEE